MQAGPVEVEAAWQTKPHASDSAGFEDAGVAGRPSRRGGRVAGVVAGDRLEHDGGVPDATCERPDVIERPAHRQDTASGDEAVRWLVADQPAERRWPRMEPPVSEPRVPAHRPAAAAAPDRTTTRP